MMTEMPGYWESELKVEPLFIENWQTKRSCR
jgi:hypothetical protein